MKRKLHGGMTSVVIPIFAADTSSTTGGGLAGLVFGTAGLVAEYRRQGASSWTAITLSAGTLGTWSSGGFVADGSRAGYYEVGLPDAALAAGARWVAVRLYGATNLLDVRVEIELDVVDYQDGTAFGVSRLDAAVSSRSTYAGADTSGTTTLLTRVPGVVQPQTGDAYARLGATPPTASAIAAAVLAASIESGVSLQQILEAIGAATAGDYDSATQTFRAVGNHGTTRLATALTSNNRTNTPSL